MANRYTFPNFVRVYVSRFFGGGELQIISNKMFNDSFEVTLFHKMWSESVLLTRDFLVGLTSNFRIFSQLIIFNYVALLACLVSHLLNL